MMLLIRCKLPGRLFLDAIMPEYDNNVVSVKIRYLQGGSLIAAILEEEQK